MMRPRVLLADDHTMFTEGLGHILARNVEIVGAVQNGEQLLTAAQQLHPDVIVMDISMPVLNGISAARRLRELGVPSKVVFCTMHADAGFVREALAAGATGYVLKTDAGSEVIRAIRHVLRGETYLGPRVAALTTGTTEHTD